MPTTSNKTPIPLKIAIDAGHGPNTAGKRCPDGSMREFQFNRAVAELMREELRLYSTASGADVAVRFTHAEDGPRDVPLSERTAVANMWPADVFVSIHANAFGETWNEANGIETYTAKICSPVSTRLAHTVQRKLTQATGLRDRGVKQADFTVVARTKMPAVLIEAGFMTHPREAELLKSAAYRKTVALTIVEALAEVFGLKRLPAIVPEGDNDNDAPSNELAAVNVSVNGKALSSGYLIGGVSYVPARETAEALGAKVSWDSASQTVKIHPYTN